MRFLFLYRRLNQFSLSLTAPGSGYFANLFRLSFEVYFDQGCNILRPNTVIRPRINHRNSSINLSSRLNRETVKLNEHISNVLEQLQPYQSTLQQLFFNPQYSLGISATGHVENPHHRLVSAANIQQLFALGLSLDVDYYFA